MGEYYTGDFKIGLNMFSFNINLNAWLKGRDGTPHIDTMQAIRYAKEAGFDSVDITAYYIPGYEAKSMPSKSDAEIKQYARDIKALCKELDIPISGTGVFNDFVESDDEMRALHVKRVKYWIDVAAEMGAPVMRVFSGKIPEDIDELGWETIVKTRTVPALRELAEHGATKGVQVALQNHGDMMSSADQIIQTIKWVNHPNVGIINDTGYFREFRSENALTYNWYKDIAAVLPYTFNFQVKKKPAGAETTELLDLDRFFTDLRRSDYRGYVPVELLWRPGDAGHPRDRSEPPYEDITEFLVQVKAAMQRTKTVPAS
ncbi:MAG: xylose isomerase [Bacilli bacterium]|nr:xylose isomerase [Bacilli bacterium]